MSVNCIFFEKSVRIKNPNAEISFILSSMVIGSTLDLNLMILLEVFLRFTKATKFLYPTKYS